MIKRIASLDDLFIDELRDLYSAENQLSQAIPEISRSILSQELKSTLEKQYIHAKFHMSRLEEILVNLGAKPLKRKCKAMQGLIQEEREILKKSCQSVALDAAIISANQRVERFSISGYLSAQKHATQLGYTFAARLLDKNLDEGKKVEQKFTELTELIFNYDTDYAANRDEVVS